MCSPTEGGAKRRCGASAGGGRTARYGQPPHAHARILVPRASHRAGRPLI